MQILISISDAQYLFCKHENHNTIFIFLNFVLSVEPRSLLIGAFFLFLNEGNKTIVIERKDLNPFSIQFEQMHRQLCINNA